jgi:gamma-glutamyltranspeptidase/glutathione hydrolase
MGDFNKKPGETSATGDIGTPANLIDPGKRMLSSMTPALVLKDGKVVLVTGSPGGRTIINTVLSVVLGVTEYGLTGRAAVDTARLHHQWLPDRATIEGPDPSPGASPGTNNDARTGADTGTSAWLPAAVSNDVLDALRAKGHDIRVGGRQGDAHSIWIATDGTPYGVNDKRTPDSKASVPEHLTAPAARR